MIFIVGFTNTLQVQELITGFIVEQLKRIKIIAMMEEEQTLPTLIPIGRRKKQTLFLQSKEDKSKGTSQKQPSKSPLEDIKKSTQQRDKQQAILAERMHTPKIQEFDNRFQMMNEKVLSKERQKKQGKAETTDKFKETENSKALINEILYKINAKNVSEELYPVTNETIEQLKRSLEDQIAELKYEADRKENSLHSNPNNQHLKKQLQAIKKSIDRSTTIKQLYNQKINLRNKIMILQNSMLSLREENVNLKIKISKGIETIQNHMHHLPCEQEKELKIELNKSMNDYKKEKEMREKLEANISQIVLNFKRLYQEAETARLIVTHKLKELQSREKQLLTGAKEAELAEAIKDKEEKMVSEANSMKPNALDVRTRRQNQQAKNITLPSQHSTKTPQKRPVFQPSSQTDRTKAKANTSQPLFSLQEQIKRMRANQNTMITLQKR